MRRDLDIVPIEEKGRPFFLVRESEPLTGKTVLVEPAALVLATVLDGRRSLEDLRSEIAKRTGTLLKAAELKAMIDDLAKAGLLETPEMERLRREALDGFLKSPRRPARLDGQVYPRETLELSKAFGSYLHSPRGPGKPLSEKPASRPPAGLVAPHIDYPRGGWAYAWAYQALSECEPPDLVVALGVAHASPPSPWVLTRKSYETPYGPLECAQDAYKSFEDALWYDPLDDEWAHRSEHSLELAAVWLKFVWREKAPPWLPILCSSFEGFAPDKAPSSIERVDGAIAAMGRGLAALGRSRRVMILASVDLSHVGPRFGDDVPLGEETEKRVEAEDRKSLDRAMALESDPFYLSGVADGGWRKICGLSALYTGLRWISDLSGGKSKGRLLAYGQAPDPLGGLVSFASAIFESEK